MARVFTRVQQPCVLRLKSRIAVTETLPARILTGNDDAAFTVINKQRAVLIDHITNQVHILIKVGQHFGEAGAASEVVVSDRERFLRNRDLRWSCIRVVGEFIRIQPDVAWLKHRVDTINDFDAFIVSNDGIVNDGRNGVWLLILT